MYLLTDNISALYGVGEKKSAILNKLGIFTILDLLHHFPRGFQYRGNTKSIRQCEDGETVSLNLTVGTDVKTATVKNRMTISKFTAFDESGKCNIVFFNNRFADRTYIIGNSYRFFGRISHKNSQYSLTSPIAERIVDGYTLPDIVPIYPLTQGLSQKNIQIMVNTALSNIDLSTLPDDIPQKVREENNLCSYAKALKKIHNPESYEDIDIARRYFVFRELYLFALNVLNAKKVVNTNHALELLLNNSYNKDIKENESKQLHGLKEFTSILPFTLTNAQKKSIAEIAIDLMKDVPMRRLLCGDVGSGKTVCAEAAIYITLQCGYQAMLMAPTEILATQHYNEMKGMVEKFGKKCVLLVGSTNAKRKAQIQQSLENGEIDLVIGTHALISDKFKMKNCALVITDEQHRFGVNQRELLSEKSVILKNGKKILPHVLVMSATPIPRSLALTVYGDLSLSIIDELPPGRQKVDTFLVDSTYENRIDDFILKQIKEGHQVYIVCPLVESNIEKNSENLVQYDTNGQITFTGIEEEKRSSIDEYERLKEIVPQGKIGLLHGKMKAKDKNEIMDKFVSGEISVLVSTTVIEVGVNVPNSTLIVIRNAEMFGLAQLHQLRGRVGRGKNKSYCVLFSDSRGDNTKDRLGVMTETNNGFKIAERDLAIRGPGDLINIGNNNVRQSGELNFKFASLSSDIELLKQAFNAAIKNKEKLQA